MNYKELYTLEVGTIVHHKDSNNLQKVEGFLFGTQQKILAIYTHDFSAIKDEQADMIDIDDILSDWCVYEIPPRGTITVQFVARRYPASTDYKNRVVTYHKFDHRSEPKIFDNYLAHWVDKAKKSCKCESVDGYYTPIIEIPTDEPEQIITPQKKSTKKVQMIMEFSVSGYLDDYSLDEFRFAIGDKFGKFTHIYNDDRDGKDKEIQINRTHNWKGIKASYIEK